MKKFKKSTGLTVALLIYVSATAAYFLPRHTEISNTDWDAQFACALDPETAKAIRDARLPEDDHSDTCSMCGKFCAVRSMNKALAGEYIDIL